jgi:hypothetical protein
LKEARRGGRKERSKNREIRRGRWLFLNYIPTVMFVSVFPLDC